MGWQPRFSKGLYFENSCMVLVIAKENLLFKGTNFDYILLQRKIAYLETIKFWLLEHYNMNIGVFKTSAD